MKKLVALVFVAMLAGCSTFDADFEKAKNLNAPGAVEGAWVGTWSSDGGHSGELRAVITPDGKSGAIAADKNYIARFKAKWSIFTTEYSAPVVTHAELKSPNTASFTAESDLGPPLGKYSMEGTSTPTSFAGKYKASGDQGTIDLKRP